MHALRYGPGACARGADWGAEAARLGNLMLRKTLICLIALTICLAGCADVDPSQRVIFLDGAGHFGAATSVKHGLRGAGYKGEVRGFVWTSGLLWGADHVLATHSPFSARRLAGQIEDFRESYPDGQLMVMALSAGSAVAVNALERLSEDVMVDDVVFFQPSISATHDLSPALRHVTHRLYATCSRRDAILAGLLVNADGKPGPPAGRNGFRVPLGLSKAQRNEYRKVVNLPWLSKYKRHGWNGGHVASTRSRFVENVIAPRVLPKTPIAKTSAAPKSPSPSGKRQSSGDTKPENRTPDPVSP